MSAGQIEGLGRGDARDQTVGDLGRGHQCRRVLGTAENQIAVDLVGHQDQIVRGAEARQCAKLICRPNSAAGIVRAAKENDFRPRRQLAAQRIEIHRVAACGLDKLRVDNAPLVGHNDLAEGVIGGRKDHDLVAGRTDGLKDETEPRHDAGRRADPARVHLQTVAARHPIHQRCGPASGVGVIAVGGSLNLGGERRRHARGRGEVHVRNPHRNRIG